MAKVTPPLWTRIIRTLLAVAVVIIRAFAIRFLKAQEWNLLQKSFFSASDQYPLLHRAPYPLGEVTILPESSMLASPF